MSNGEKKNGRMISLSLPVVLIILGMLATLLTSSLLAYSDACSDIRANSENIKAVKEQMGSQLRNIDAKIDNLRQDVKDLGVKFDKWLFPWKREDK